MDWRLCFNFSAGFFGLCCNGLKGNKTLPSGIFWGLDHSRIASRLPFIAFVLLLFLCVCFALFLFHIDMKFLKMLFWRIVWVSHWFRKATVSLRVFTVWASLYEACHNSHFRDHWCYSSYTTYLFLYSKAHFTDHVASSCLTHTLHILAPRTESFQIASIFFYIFKFRKPHRAVQLELLTEARESNSIAQ